MQVTNLRLITVECYWTFSHMASMGWLPRNITRPSDKYIRAAAGACCSEHFVDPGNLQWDILFHILRLDRFVSIDAVERVIRTAPAEYGSSSNKSSKGAVNLRGNILEAALRDLQWMGSTPARGRGQS